LLKFKTLGLKVKLSRYCHVDAKGERRYSSNSFLTSALGGGEWSASRHGRALSPGMDPRYPLDRRHGIKMDIFSKPEIIIFIELSRITMSKFSNDNE
jgi:hypothetical protein